ncbi:uncharacterized protein MELLADRAFT_109998 [Melampsora larici-populina 98AG31]|uniref:Uncharacterized protein n=1 Tax=Melampsora larici-populina (strain 98AG31 / pathotype 3-4-7) TaxID=747676 RepID=F4RYB2_MELLP|nr:uncharacterized protein MELLADRAFT_109998 [Melampsora larici-populina 98AG31]EGG02646.1 hypothetical protein MELLADRAFT_109998 [Melampsora larici-populina 98AG31]
MSLSKPIPAANKFYHNAKLLGQFYKIKFTCETCVDFCKEIRTSLSQLARAGVDLPDNFVFFMVTAKLPEEMAMRVEKSLNSDLDVDLVLHQIQQDASQQIDAASSNDPSVGSSSNVITASPDVSNTIEQILLDSTGINFEIWQDAMQKKLEDLFLWNTTTRPRVHIKACDSAWFTMLETKSYDVIMESLDERSAAIAKAYSDLSFKTGSGLWQYLQDRFSTTTFDRKRKFRITVEVSNKNITDHMRPYANSKWDAELQNASKTPVVRASSIEPCHRMQVSLLVC